MVRLEAVQEVSGMARTRLTQKHRKRVRIGLDTLQVSCRFVRLL